MRPERAEAAAGRKERMQRVISRLLRLGVVTSLAAIVLGTALSFFHHPDHMTSPAALSFALGRAGA